MKRLFRRIIAILLILGLALRAFPALADELSEAQKKQKELQSSLNNANKLIKSLSQSKASTEEKINSLDKEIASAEAKSGEFESQINVLNDELTELNASIEETKGTISDKENDMRLRIIYSYENGKNNILDAVFHSKSMTEFLNIMQYSFDLAEYEQEEIVKYEQALSLLSKQEDALSKKQADAQELARKNEEQLAAVSALRSAKETELAGIEGEITDAKELALIYEKEVQAQNEVLAAIKAAIEAEKKRQEEERRRKEEEARKKALENGEEGSGVAVFAISGNVSGFVWPCPSSKRITSEFGERESPTAGASTNHKGIDIGASTGSDIVAVQSGKVIVSQYSASAGNYVIVSHGMNAAGKIICTVYMHASERLVQVGDEVSKGQVIAKVGSTGYSTGPHLHFGVSEDGTYVNPWGYL